MTTIAAHAMTLERYDSHRIHGVHLPVPDVVNACDDLLSMNREWRKALPYMHPGRVDVIGAGALIWREVIGRVVQRSGIHEVRVSEHDILDGIALEHWPDERSVAASGHGASCSPRPCRRAPAGRATRPPGVRRWPADEPR